MSKAGIQSNRGDGYQTLIAFQWALFVLSDPEYEWIEVDSVGFPVDDVVIGKSDGTVICCQCKKNQALHKSWSISDLADDLLKAGTLLTTNRLATVRFYSRSPFGELSALREISTGYSEQSTFQDALTQTQTKTLKQLANLLSSDAQAAPVLPLLKRIIFETSPALDFMRSALVERLSILSSNPSAAFNALWTALDYLGMRFDDAAITHRLTKRDLLALVNEAGAMLTPPMDLRNVRASFTSTSAIGRAWRRDIGKQRLDSPTVRELISNIDEGHPSILLVGSPGSGKTCVMLAAQDILEERAKTRDDLVSLFIQSREFANAFNAQDRQSQGLAEQWVESVARMAEQARVIVMIDSLDVLSIAREHGVLKYFLAQVDRLLNIPRVTVVVACREFDCKYDRNIAVRTWSKRIACQPLKWETEIEPLLSKLDIDVSPIDAATRGLMSTPRELALYVELAQKNGSFSIVTSQALAQRYLAAIVETDRMLGDPAMQALEGLATEMIKSRSLSIPRQRFSATKDIEHALLSNDVLREMQNRHLTFGHQTLLDVLVINGAVRHAMSLQKFAHSLPPVPFVRPTIRSFATHLMSGDRRELRKQLRAVFFGSDAFHIRRLVAETFAEQAPLDDDWPMIRDLWSQRRDIFQVIYIHGTRIEWHQFWMSNLVPLLLETHDVSGLATHVYHLAMWVNFDPIGVNAFWNMALDNSWLNQPRIVDSLSSGISQVKNDHAPIFSSLLIRLTQLPRRPHSFLGQTLARFVEEGCIEDAVLWQYISGDITNEDLQAYRWGGKLHCQPYEFGNSDDSFISHRMRTSSRLLELAVHTLEQWSDIKHSNCKMPTGEWRQGFLHRTSYSDLHTQTDIRHVDNDRLLFNAIEAAITHHAATHSLWWKNNRTRLCNSAEGALRFFVVKACSATPESNLDIIGPLLRDTSMLDSDLAHELGTLMQNAFLLLSPDDQDVIQSTIVTAFGSDVLHDERRAWRINQGAQLLICVPCHIRSTEACSLLAEAQREQWPLLRSPAIFMSGGCVSSPFDYEVFVRACDDGVLRLLEHYREYDDARWHDGLVGGEQEVLMELGEATSRFPSRFLDLLSQRFDQFSELSREAILSGVVRYLKQRYGNYKPHADWSPINEPIPTELSSLILDELSLHADAWHHTRAAAEAVESCAYVVARTKDAARLVKFAEAFLTLDESSSVSASSNDLLTSGINMSRGKAAHALMIAANKLIEANELLPGSLCQALRRFSADDYAEVRAIVLWHLPYIQSRHPRFGWELFRLTMNNAPTGLWKIAERCLYHSYDRHFNTVAPWLAKLASVGAEQNMEIWGRISALSALSGHKLQSDFLLELHTLSSLEAWRGAARVWNNLQNLHRNREICIAGIRAGLFADTDLPPEISPLTV